MPKHHYVVVGAPVDAPVNKLTFPQDGPPIIEGMNGNTVATLAEDPTLDKVAGPGPLTVETIGKIMVEMSERRDMSKAMEENRTKVVKAALTVIQKQQDLAPDEKRLTPGQMRDILNATEVRIIHEERDTTGAVDKNLRILVVPADNTLQLGVDRLANAPAPDALPPLTYPLDRSLMLASMRSKIEGFIKNYFADKPDSDPTKTLEAELVDFVSKAITDEIQTELGDSTYDQNEIKNEILKAPMRAFYRSVGIYATNMCR